MYVQNWNDLRPCQDVNSRQEINTKFDAKGGAHCRLTANRSNQQSRKMDTPRIPSGPTSTRKTGVDAQNIPGQTFSTRFFAGLILRICDLWE
jgi:hypothetical protein